MRSGDWKLVAKAGGAWELYDIAHDRVEAKNLAAEQPEKVRELSDKYQTYAKRALVLPKPGQKRNGK